MLVALSCSGGDHHGLVAPFDAAVRAGDNAASGTWQATASDRQRLTELYNETGGSGWTNATNWLDAAAPLNDWYGVTAGSSDQVTALWLHNNNLSGEVPGAAIGALATLDTLNLGRNQLAGAIPAGLADATGLRVLFLQRNQFSGAIPAELGKLGELRLLNLRYNQLTGAIPAELGDLANLETLNLRNNQLTGALPAELASLTSLTRFLVSDNSSLCRPDDAAFTTWLNGLDDTDALDLPVCVPDTPPPPAQPTGLAAETDAATPAQTMELSFTEVADAVAANTQYRVRGREAGAQWTAWATLAEVTVESGQVRGRTGEHAVGKAYEAELRACGETQSDETCSDASDSAFGATASPSPAGAAADTTSPPSTSALRLSWTIEDAGEAVDAAYEIGYSADTTDTAPETFLDAADVPAFTANSVEVSGLAADTGYRLFVRSKVAWDTTRYYESAWASAVGRTEQETTDPPEPPPSSTDRGTLAGLYDATNGSDWTTSTNWLDSAAALNDWHGVTADGSDVVSNLWLFDNNLSGPAPGSLGELAGLDTLNLGRNQLTGSVPAGLADASSLQVLFLQRNQFSGAIPAELGKLGELRLLNLRYNQLTGAIPAELGDLANLEILNLRNNQLAGALPAELASLTSLARFLVSDNASLCRPDDSAFTTWLNGLGDTDALDLPVCVPDTPPPPAQPTGLAAETDAATPAQTMKLSFGEVADAVAANAQYRVRGREAGAQWTVWATLAGVTVEDGKVRGRTRQLAPGKAYEAQVRACGETQSDETCSEASESAFGATAAPAPTGASADTTAPPSTSALRLSWTIEGAADAADAAYEIGYSADTADAAPATFLEAADVPAFTENAAEVAGLAADTEYRLFVRSTVAWEGTRYFTSPWASAVARTEAHPPPPATPDREVLTTLYNETGGSGWTTSTNWLDTASVLNDWYGITADSADQVSVVRLSSNNLSGALPDTLGTLAGLDTLDLSSNQLTGEIPAKLGGLAKLRYLSLGNNQLTGEIPPELGALSTLEELHLDNTQLAGPLPTELGALNSLTTFKVGTGHSLCRPQDDGLTTWMAGLADTDVLDAPQCPRAPVLCDNGQAGDYPCEGVDLISRLTRLEIGATETVNDIWGWTDPVTGIEWALVGHSNGTSFVGLEDAEAPFYAGILPKTAGTRASVWRDIKVYSDHAFIVADGAGSHGMQVFDLTQLRNVSDAPVTFQATALYNSIASAHNIVINEATGFAYSVGSSGSGETCGGGLHMINISSPGNPTFAGCFADPLTGFSSRPGYTHDAQCVVYNGPDSEHEGKEICFGSNETKLSIADVSDKDAPVSISTGSYPKSKYTHQGWLDEAHEYFYMDDELDEYYGLTAKTRTLVWDVRDLDDPVMVTEFIGTTTATDHNLYVKGDLVYQSNNAAGLRILDISDRENPEEVAYFDNDPETDAAGFRGSWSNYPFFASGIIAVTERIRGVFFVKLSEN